MKRPSFPRSNTGLWRQSSLEVLTSKVVTGRRPGPLPPAPWAPALQQLTTLLRKPIPAPAWWTLTNAYLGSIETRTDPESYALDGLTRMGRHDAPFFAFQLTLAGWGYFQTHGRAPQCVAPGTAFISIVPSPHRYYLPAESPGWTFGWISFYHPYLLARITKQVAATGPLVAVAPDSALAAISLRLMRGAIKKDFRDRFEVEQALFEFLVACERNMHQTRGSDEGQSLLDEVRARVGATLPRAFDVSLLAADYSMSRSHFSHFFKSKTGLTPARFTTEVRIHEARRLLLDQHLPLEQVAAACGFANANYFCKVFRRYQHMSPTAYRRAVR